MDKDPLHIPKLFGTKESQQPLTFKVDLSIQSQASKIPSPLHSPHSSTMAVELHALSQPLRTAGPSHTP